jgi:hypothetical protein
MLWAPAIRRQRLYDMAYLDYDTYWSFLAFDLTTRSGVVTDAVLKFTTPATPASIGANLHLQLFASTWGPTLDTDSPTHQGAAISAELLGPFLASTAYTMPLTSVANIVTGGWVYLALSSTVLADTPADPGTYVEDLSWYMAISGSPVLTLTLA